MAGKRAETAELYSPTRALLVLLRGRLRNRKMKAQIDALWPSDETPGPPASL